MSFIRLPPTQQGWSVQVKEEGNPKHLSLVSHLNGQELSTLLEGLQNQHIRPLKIVITQLPREGGGGNTLWWEPR